MTFPVLYVWRRLACLLLAGLAGCAQDAGLCRMLRVTDLPFVVAYNHLLTRAVLNDQPAIMVIDTGAAVSSIVASRKAHFGLHPFITDSRMIGVGGERRVYGLIARRFQIGALHGENLDLTMADFELPGGGADGLLGSDYLSGYDLDLDFPGRKLRLYKVLEGCRTPGAPLSEPLYQAPLTAAPNAYDRSPFVLASIGGKTFLAKIDSGADRTVLFKGAAQRLGLTAAMLAADEQHEVAGVGPHRVAVAKHIMAPITIGEITIANLPVAVADARMGDGTEMLLGLDFLSRVHAFVAYSSKTLIMQYPPKPSPQMPH